MTPEQRLWSKFEVDDLGCWNYTGGLNPGGYGNFKVNGKTVSAHKYAYEIALGVCVPATLHVCHRCDNRRCINPEHLFVGTAKDNNQDKSRKGRTAVNKTAAKITPDQVRVIRALWSTGQYSQGAIGKIYGLGQQAISLIVRGKNWRDIAA